MATVNERYHETEGVRREPVVVSDEPVVVSDEPVVVSDEIVDATAPVGPIARAIALAAAGLMAIVGLVACVQIDWSQNGFDAPSVQVLDITFAPVTAVVVAVLGLVAIAASVGRVGDGRVAMGAVLTVLGLVVVIADGGPAELELTDRLGWFTTGIGVVLLLAGLASSGRLATRRTTERVSGY